MFSRVFVPLLILSELAVAAPNPCSKSTFSTLSLFNGKIQDIATSQISNYSSSSAIDGSFNHFPEDVKGLDACEVAIQYTHPGQNDTINVLVWLPLNWTGRFMGLGGGGWTTGYGTYSLAWPASKGFAAGSTDGGHLNSTLPDSWGLVSPGNVNYVLLQDFSATALDDLATLGKAATAAFYGEKPKYSYWNGCSTGGRQGLMMAQRYPEQYSGILASAPAINWGTLVPADYWPQLVMNEQGVYPPQCELEAFTKAAISACDAIDGVKDGIINDPGACTFDPFSVVGQSSNCSSGASVTLTKYGAAVAQAMWTGPKDSSGKKLWYGLNPGASFEGTANTTLGANGSYTGVPFTVTSDWIRLFIEKNANFDVKTLTRDGLAKVIRQSVNEYRSIIGTDDPDLTDFKKAGGKMITWHGLADELISPNGTFEYYDKVGMGDGSVADYYRIFAAPGIAHCYGGVGWFPGNIFTDLTKWVEQGKAPEITEARTLDGTNRTVNLCRYPKKLKYIGGNANATEGYGCV